MKSPRYSYRGGTSMTKQKSAGEEYPLVLGYEDITQKARRLVRSRRLTTGQPV